MTDEEIIDIAKDSCDEGISFDDNPEVSRAADGAWVAAWVWVEKE